MNWTKEKKHQNDEKPDNRFKIQTQGVLINPIPTAVITQHCRTCTSQGFISHINVA